MIKSPPREQVTGFPARTVDLRTVKDEELPALGLPPRPLDAQLRRGWGRLFDREVEIRSFHKVADLVVDRVEPQPPEIQTATRFQDSRNWSGATIAAHGDQSLVVVMGLWRMPTVGAVPIVPGKPGALSMWVGLDGTRRDFDSSLPQIGTTATVKAGGVEYSAWTQWWARDTNDTGPTTLDFPVAPGDLIGGAVFVRDAFTVGMVLINFSSVVPVCLPVTVTSPWVKRAGGLQQPRISGGSAEWILERPALLPTAAHPLDRELAPFPSYAPTAFEFCAAGAARTVDLAGVFAAESRDLVAARRVRMIDRLSMPSRTAFLSMPTVIGSDRIDLRYGGF